MNRAELATDEATSSKSTSGDKSTLEAIVADQIEKLKHQIKFSIDSLKTRTKQTDQLLAKTIEKLKKKSSSDRPSSKSGKTMDGMPLTINLPDLPLVRVQERRNTDLGQDAHSSNLTFERRRRTTAGSVVMNSATD